MSERSIIQVTLWNSPYLGNVMTSQLALAERVRAELGLRTHFVLADGALGQPWLAELDAAGVSWSVLPPGRAGWRGHLRRVVRDERAALIDTHFTAADLPGASAAVAAGVPCVWHVRTGFTGYPLAQRVKDVLKMHVVARRRVARIVAVSPWLGELMRRRGAPRDRIVTIENAIVTERFARLPDRATARARFGLAPASTVVLALGWWPQVKGVDLVVAAAKQLVAGHQELALLLIGEQQMRAFLAERLPETPPWLHVHGFVEDAASLFAAADVFVSASRHEGLSSAVGEALACGLPVVLSDIPGTRPWSKAPGALTFPSEDASALAARLDVLLSQPVEDRRAVGERNRDWITRQAGIDSWCERVCALYRELLPTSGPD